MALTLGNPTLPTPTRNALANQITSLIDTPTDETAGELALIGNPGGGDEDLVVIDLVQPSFGGAVTGVITLLGVPLQGTAIAGSATTPTSYEIRDRATGRVVVASGPVTGTGPITTLDTVELSAYVWTQPAA